MILLVIAEIRKFARAVYVSRPTVVITRLPWGPSVLLQARMEDSMDSKKRKANNECDVHKVATPRQNSENKKEAMILSTLGHWCRKAVPVTPPAAVLEDDPMLLAGMYRTTYLKVKKWETTTNPNVALVFIKKKYMIPGERLEMKLIWKELNRCHS